MIASGKTRGKYAEYLEDKRNGFMLTSDKASNFATTAQTANTACIPRCNTHSKSVHGH